MASEWCDGFLKLVKDGQPIEGESTDAKFGTAQGSDDTLAADFATLFGDGDSADAKIPGLIEVISFTFGSSDKFPDPEAQQYAAQGRRPSNDTLGADFASLFGD